MSTVQCVRLKKELPALLFAPYPGELGQKILETVSQDAWKDWLDHQTRVINENGLNLLDEVARNFLKEELERFVSGEILEKPMGFDGNIPHLYGEKVESKPDTNDDDLFHHA
ncbi:oxidative damage protection protein [Vibrio owensii]|uniref:oxidative damage protection protein n=1 Tax=Vibrio harveyi group TaxID=717610 RepID=UPI003CC671D9